MTGPQRARASTVSGIETVSGNFPGAAAGDGATDVAGAATSPSAVPVNDGDGAQVAGPAATSAPWNAFGEDDSLSAFPPPAPPMAAPAAAPQASPAASPETTPAASPEAAIAATAAVPATSSSPAAAGTPAVSEDAPSVSTDGRSPVDALSTGAAAAPDPDRQATFSDSSHGSGVAAVDAASVPAKISAEGTDDEKLGEGGAVETMEGAAAAPSEVTPTGGGGGEMETLSAASAADSNATPSGQPATVEAVEGITDSTGSSEGGPAAEAAGAAAVVPGAVSHVSVLARVRAVEVRNASSKKKQVDATEIPVVKAAASATEEPDEFKTSKNKQDDSIPLATAAADATVPVPPSPDASDVASNLSPDLVDETTRQPLVTALSSSPSNETEYMVATAVEQSVDVPPKEIEATLREFDSVARSTARASGETDKIVAADQHVDSSSCEKADTAVDGESCMMPDSNCIVEQSSPVVSGGNSLTEVSTEGAAEGNSEQSRMQDDGNVEEELSPSSMMRPEISRSRSFSNANSEMSATDTRTPTPRSRLPGAVSRIEYATLAGLSGKVLDKVLDTQDSPGQSSSEQAPRAIESTPSPTDAAAGTAVEAVAGDTVTAEAFGRTLGSVDVSASPIAAPQGEKNSLATRQQAEQGRQQGVEDSEEPPQHESGEPPRKRHEQVQHLAAEAAAKILLNSSSSSSSFSSSPSFTAVTPSAVAGVPAASPSGGVQSAPQPERPLAHPRLEVVERVVVLAGPETLLAPAEAATAHARAPLLISNPRFTSIPSLPEHATADQKATSTVSLADLWEGGQTTR